MYFVNAAVRKLAPERRACVLAALNIPQAWLALGNARVPAATFSALWLAVARELDDEFFGLDSRSMKVGSFALLCQAVLGCEELGRAVRRMLRAFGLFLDDIRGELVVDGEAAMIRIASQIEDPADRRFADETLLVLMHGLMCWLVGRRIVIHRVDFAHPRPAHIAEYTRMLSKDLSFDAPQTAIHFDAGQLASGIKQDPASLSRFLRTAPQSVFLKYRNEDSWTARVRRRLRLGQTRDSWPAFEELAREFGLSPSTFRRRLEAEGGSYQQIKDQLRNDWVIDRLRNSSMSIDEIAAQLGYHDASVFHRAFKRWNGLQPGEYRRRQLA